MIKMVVIDYMFLSDQIFCYELAMYGIKISCPHTNNLKTIERKKVQLIESVIRGKTYHFS